MRNALFGSQLLTITTCVPTAGCLMVLEGSVFPTPVRSERTGSDGGSKLEP